MIGRDAGAGPEGQLLGCVPIDAPFQHVLFAGSLEERIEAPELTGVYPGDSRCDEPCSGRGDYDVPVQADHGGTRVLIPVRLAVAIAVTRIQVQALGRPEPPGTPDLVL